MLKVTDDNDARHAKLNGQLIDPTRTDTIWDVRNAVRENPLRGLRVCVLLPFRFIALSLIEPFDDEVFGVDVVKQDMRNLMQKSK